MYVFVHLNGIGVKGMIDTGVTRSCLASSVAAKLNLRIELHANVIIPLNGMDQRVDGLIQVVLIQMRAWSGQCEMMVLYLQDFELILGMDFLMEAEVGILPYLRVLAFLERRTPCTTNTLREAGMAGSSSKMSEESGHQDIVEHKPLSLGRVLEINGWLNSEVEEA